MEDVEEKPTSESSSRNAETGPLTETFEENTEMITLTNASDNQSVTQDEYILIDDLASSPKDIVHEPEESHQGALAEDQESVALEDTQDEYILIDNSASSPKDIVHEPEQSHQGALAEDQESVALQDCFHRQHDDCSTVTASGDVDNLMNLSTSSSETKDLQIETKEPITDPSPTNVADVPVENLASNPNAFVHVTEQNHQEAVAVDSEPEGLEDIFNRKQDGGSILSADSGVDNNQKEILASEEKGSQNDNNELKIDLPQTKATDIAVGAVERPTTAKHSSSDADNLMELSTSSSETKELQIGSKEALTDPPPINVTDVSIENLVSTTNSCVLVTEQNHQEAVAADSEPGALEDGGSIVSAESGVDNQMEISASEKKGSQNDNNELKIDLPQTKATDIAVGAVDPHTTAKQIAADRTIIDTAAPFESVKEAVSKFGEIVNWKPPRSQTAERHKEVEQELEKANEEIPQYQKRSEAAEEAKVQVLQELDSTKRLIEELKLNLERAQIEERQAKQDSELAKLRVEEMEQGVAEDSSVAAKAQLEVAKARYTTATSELVSVKEELEKLRKEYTTAVTEKDEVMKKAEDAVAASKQVEKTVEDLTFELIATKESFETAHAAHMEAEEHRIGKDQDILDLENELKQAEAELERFNQKILSAKDLKSKLSKASDLLLDLRAELNAHMESNSNQKGDEKGDLEQQENKIHNEIQAAVASAKKELEEVKLNIEKVIAEVDNLKVAATTLRSELEQEKSALASLRQRHRIATITVEELDKEDTEKILKIPQRLQKAVEEATQANLLAQAAREEQQRVKEEAKQANDVAHTMQSRLLAVQKEIEAAKASEKLAIAAIKALQKSESARSKNEMDSVNGVILSVEEYYQLSKQVHEAEEKANVTVATTNSEIEIAKESELKTFEKLNDVNKEMAARRESLKIAMENAEKAREGQLSVEQQLRKWKAEDEQRRQAGEIGQQLVNQNSSQSDSFDSSTSKEPNNGSGSSLEPKAGKKKKKMRTLYKLSLTIGCKNCKN